MAQQDNTLQPNWNEYQQGMMATSPQTTQNAIAAKAAEASINNCLGAGWAQVGGPAQGAANPKGVGALPSGATGLKVKAPGKIIKR